MAWPGSLGLNRLGHVCVGVSVGEGLHVWAGMGVHVCQCGFVLCFGVLVSLCVGLGVLGST